MKTIFNKSRKVRGILYETGALGIPLFRLQAVSDYITEEQNRVFRIAHSKPSRKVDLNCCQAARPITRVVNIFGAATSCEQKVAAY